VLRVVRLREVTRAVRLHDDGHAAARRRASRRGCALFNVALIAIAFFACFALFGFEEWCAPFDFMMTDMPRLGTATRGDGYVTDALTAKVSGGSAATTARVRTSASFEELGRVVRRGRARENDCEAEVR
jgi:hypothetical protein